MAKSRWRLVLCGGISAAVIAAFFGETAQAGVLLLSGVVCIASIRLGVSRWKPEQTGPWKWLAACAALQTIASVMRAGSLGATGAPSMADLVSFFVYVALIGGLHSLGRHRAHDQDPTNLIDALVFTVAVGVLLGAAFMVPFVEDLGSTNGERLTGVLFVLFDLAVFFTVARLAIGPGTRTTSYYLVAFMAVGVLLTDIVVDASLASMHFYGSGVLPIFLPTLVFLSGAGAAIHPSMAGITERVTIEVARITTRRLLVVGLAAVLPPIVLVVTFRFHVSWTYMVVLGPWCLVINVLVMLRFAGMGKARERMADLERALSAAATSLVSETSRQAMYTTALSAAAEMVGKDTAGLHISAAVRDDEKWTITTRWPSNEAIPGDPFDSEHMERLLESPNRCPVRLEGPQLPKWLSSGAPHVLLAPLVSQNQLRGALIISSSKPIPSAILNALGSLATDVSLALEAASLAEDLHRQRSNRRFRALVENSADLIVVLNDDDGITFLSPTAERLLAGRHGDVRALLATVHEEDRLAILTLLQAAHHHSVNRSVECRLIDSQGETHWYEATACDMRSDPEVSGIVLNAHNITGRKLLEEDLRHKVLHDDLTGIANRALLRDRLNHSLASRRTSSAGPAVLLIDLDDFKTVNDGLGHGAGDELLKVIAFRLKSFLRLEDTAARLGGDEFAVLLEEIKSQEDAIEIANRLLLLIAEPMEFGNRTVTVTASIGITFAGQASDSEVVLRNADVAMYHAKSKGKAGVQVFDETMYLGAIERLELKNDLAHAIDRKELVLYYQPLVDLSTGVLTGFEALLRWNHSVRGFVSPATFIPIAEETGLITSIGDWVIGESVRQLARWQQERINDGQLKMSVNVSPHQLNDDHIVEVISAALTERGVDPSSVTLELTETAVLEDPDARQRVFALRELGVGIAADDFGSGFASYAALQQLPFTTVKIDRSLVMGIPDDSGMAEAQIRSIVEMAHTTGMKVVVEGIEEPVQRDLLISVGCDTGQGYLFSRPLPPAEARNWTGVPFPLPAKPRG